MFSMGWGQIRGPHLSLPPPPPSSCNRGAELRVPGSALGRRGGVSRCFPPHLLSPTPPPPSAPSPTSAPSWLRAPPGGAGAAPWGAVGGGGSLRSPLGRLRGGGGGGEGMGGGGEGSQRLASVRQRAPPPTFCSGILFARRRARNWATVPLRGGVRNGVVGSVVKVRIPEGGEKNGAPPPPPSGSAPFRGRSLPGGGCGADEERGESGDPPGRPCYGGGGH